jgi:O-glycosyl hydrolase
MRPSALGGLAVVALTVWACGSDRGVPENIAGGWSGGGVEGVIRGSCDSLLPAPVDGAAVVALDAKTSYQKMRGFGASMRVFDDPRVTNTIDPTTKRATAVPPVAVQRAILNSLWDSTGIGLTRVRFMIGDGDTEPVNDDADPLTTDTSKFDFSWKNGDDQIGLVRSSALGGMRSFYVSVPTLEPWMTQATPQEYAEWLVMNLRHWRARGSELLYISLKDRPGSAAGGGVLSGEYLRDVTKILGARIDAEGLYAKIVVPDDVNPTEGLGRLRVILADPDARQYIGAVAYHPGDSDAQVQIRQLAAQYDIPVWAAGLDAPDWIDMASRLHAVIAEGGASAVDYAWAFFGDQESGTQLVRLISHNGAYAGFDFTKQYYALGQYSRYVAPDAVRIAATSNDPEVKATAYVRDYDARLTVVVTHLGKTNSRLVRIEMGVGARCRGGVAIVQTSDAVGLEQLGTFRFKDARFGTTVPPRSITTFVAATD